jgi:hypothetical protein
MTTEYQCHVTVTLSLMNALSRREEDTLLKTTKAYALKQCDNVLQGALDFTLISY